MRPVRPLRSRLTLVLPRCVCEARAYLNTSSAAVCTRRLSVSADAVVSAASREIQASPLRPSSRSLWTTTTRLWCDTRELLRCQAGRGNCGIQVNPCPLIGIRRRHQEEAVDVARKVALEAAYGLKVGLPLSATGRRW